MQFTKIALALGLVAVTSALPHKTSNLQPRQSEANPPPSSSQASAIYLMSNDPKGNSVQAIPIAPDGSLSLGQGMKYPTGGKGGAMAASPKYDPKDGALDALNSAGSVKVAGNKVYVVNAGSNTLSLFNVSCTDPTQMQLIGEPKDTLGDFPTTVAATSVNDVACAVNTGAKSGVSCFGLDLNGLVPLDSLQRPIKLPTQQTTPPTGPFSTVSHAMFSNDLQELLVTVKGDENGDGGYLVSWPVQQNSLIGTNPTISKLANTKSMGAMQNVDNGKIAIVDSITGTVIASEAKNNSGSFTTTGFTPAADQNLRWVTKGPATGHFYASTAAPAGVLAMDDTSKILKSNKFSTNLGSSGPSIAANNFLYTLSYGSGSSGIYLIRSQVEKDGTLTQLDNLALNGFDHGIEGIDAFIFGNIDQQCAGEVNT